MLHNIIFIISWNYSVHLTGLNLSCLLLHRQDSLRHIDEDIQQYSFTAHGPQERNYIQIIVQQPGAELCQAQVKLGLAMLAKSIFNLYTKPIEVVLCFQKNIEVIFFLHKVEVLFH